MTTSVAMCTYNGARFIEEQLRSIIDQTIPVGEVVVCDDCSTDKTVAIITEIAKETPIPIRIYINEKNLGCVANFEKAISLCNGEVIFLSDQDDVWMPNKVEVIVDWFDKRQDKDVVISDAVLIDENGTQLTSETYFSLYFDENSRKLFDEGYGIELFAQRNRACGATMAIRKKMGQYFSSLVHDASYANILKRCIEYNIIHDYLMAILSIGNGSFSYVIQPLTRYRQHVNQVCGVGQFKNKLDDEVWFVDFDKGDRLCALPFEQNAKRRVNFIYWRSTLRKKIYTPILVLFKTRLYKNIYGMRYGEFIVYDLKVSFQNTIERLKRFFQKILIKEISVIFISYGDENFKRSLKRISREARSLGIFDKVITYTPKDLSDEIKQSPLMNYKRGGGYWLWKPYLIWETMQKYPNAMVVYADAGCTLNKNFQEWKFWFEIMKNTDTLLTCYQPNVDYGWDMFDSQSVKIEVWTKRATIEYFDSLFNSSDWHNCNKIWGGFIIAKNKSRLLKDVLDIMLSRPELVIDPTVGELYNQHSEFCQHRHDQSIITPLAYWYKMKNPNLVEIIPETGESSRTAAVVASRIKDVNIIPLKTRVILHLKSILGERIYNFLHFRK